MDIDQLVIEKVMGWKEVFSDDYDYFKGECVIHSSSKKFSPSTNIQDAWEIVDQFDMVDVNKDYNGEFECVIYACDKQGKPIECWIENAKTAPLVICKAALKANGINL